MASTDLKENVLSHGRGQLGSTLTPAAADAHEQRVAIVLLQDATDSRDVLYGELEHHQRHLRAGQQVVLVQVVLHTLCQCLQLFHLSTNKVRPTLLMDSTLF